MAKQSISKNQLHALQNGGLLNLGESKSQFKKISLDDLANTLTYLGSEYAINIAEEMGKAVSNGSSGKGADSIAISDVKIFGSTYTIEVNADEYIKFISEGVDGWGGASKGGKYKFKSKGTPKAMVDSIKNWLIQGGNLNRIASKSNRKSITDAATQQARSTAFMIKRQGIRPKKFIQKATDKTARLASEELGKALRVDIINNLTS
jgi:hypothetical protein